MDFAGYVFKTGKNMDRKQEDIMPAKFTKKKRALTKILWPEKKSLKIVKMNFKSMFSI